MRDFQEGCKALKEGYGPRRRMGTGSVGAIRAGEGRIVGIRRVGAVERWTCVHASPSTDGESVDQEEWDDRGGSGRPRGWSGSVGKGVHRLGRLGAPEPMLADALAQDAQEIKRHDGAVELTGSMG